MVITCAARVALISSTMAASVVLLPLPVVPVTRIRPRSSAAIGLEDRRQRQLVDRGHANRDDAEDHPDGAALLEGVAAEAAESGDAVGEVDLVMFLETFAMGRGQDSGCHGQHVFVIETLLFGWPA